MKKKVLAIAFACAAAFGLFALAGCGGGNGDSSAADGDAATSGASGAISVISREDGSGTRSAFVELTGVEEKDASGEKVDMTTTSAIVSNSTSVVMTTVAGDPNAIGYISLGSLNETVKAVSIDGVAPTAEGVKDGTYSIARPFNVVTSGTLSEPAQDFLNFIMSKEGQQIVTDEGYVSVADSAQAFTGGTASGKVVCSGSSSVTPVMEKLAEAYQAINPNVTIEVQQSDSTTGVNNAIEGVCDLGMASRELKDSETSQGVTPTVIAMDGIAVVVNNANTIASLSVDQIKQIYTGELTDWSEVA